MRAHLGSCGPCRQHYERRLVLAELDPTAAPFHRRLAAGLGVAPTRSRGWVKWCSGASALVVTALVLVVLRPADRPADLMASDMRARGSSTAVSSASGPTLSIYRVSDGAPPTPVADSLAADDELAFAYANPTALNRLFVFGRDEHGHLFWYHPTWTDDAADPEGVAITATDQTPRELPLAIRHPLDGRELTIYAVFTDAPLTVRQMEALVSGTPSGALPVDGVQITRRLRIDHRQ